MEKEVFCSVCSKQIPEEQGLYQRTTGKFFCSFRCIDEHHPKGSGIVETTEENAQLLLNYEHPNT